MTRDDDRSGDDSAVRAVVDTLVQAICRKDVDAAMSVFAPGVVSFDLGPPLRHGGGDDFRKHLQAFFDAYDGTIVYELCELVVRAEAGLAFVHSLNRTAGTLRGGAPSSRWLRWTVCLVRIEDRWRIVHEHVSVPVDVPAGKALLELQP